MLPVMPDVTAPDGSDVRILAATGRGSMAYFRLSPGQVARAIVHRTVDEVWFVAAGRGRMWRKSAGEETVAEL
jgi:mannose-6-phosphate isomerase-like protein (cupin superfamily)